MIARFALCGLLVLTAMPGGAGERLALRVSPAVAFAPASLIVRATIEADAANRAMAVSAESADFYRESDVQLDGEHAPRTTQLEFRDLPPGSYEVKALLVDAEGHTRASVRQTVAVLSSGSGR